MNPSNNNVGPQTREKKKPPRALQCFAGLSLLGGLQVATQVFAHAFNYHPALGKNFPALGNIYAPWSVVGWAVDYYTLYPHVVNKAASAGIVVAGGGLLAVAIAKIVGVNSATASQYLHGSARWANPDDIRAARLVPRKLSWKETALRKPKPDAAGVFVGAYVQKDGQVQYLRHNGPEHVLCYAPTRLGKGVALVIPTLLSWPTSTVVTDLKGELWKLTAGWRQKHAKNYAVRFEPSSKDSARWNPLEEIRIGTEYEVGDAQNLVTMLVDPDGKGLDSHWQKTAFALLVGVILHALYKGRNEGVAATLPGVDRMLADPDRSAGELWMEMVTYQHRDGENHRAVGSAARDMLDRAEEEAGSVLSTAKSYLALYRDDVVAANVSACDFRISDLMSADKPCSLYIVTQPNDKARLRPLVRVMLNMIVRLLADKDAIRSANTNAPSRHRLLLMLDEFPSLGKLEILQEALAFLAGYDIKAYLICQDINQLKSRETGYGPDETITSNCHVQNAFPPNRIETAEHLSRLTGQTTVWKRGVTTSGRRISAMLGQVSTTIQEYGRPLLTPDECMRMPGAKKNDAEKIEKPGDMVIYVAGYPAIYGQQPLFFQDPVFAARAAVAEPKASDRLRKPAAPVPVDVEVAG